MCFFVPLCIFFNGRIKADANQLHHLIISNLPKSKISLFILQYIESYVLCTVWVAIAIYYPDMLKISFAQGKTMSKICTQNHIQYT